MPKRSSVIFCYLIFIFFYFSISIKDLSAVIIWEFIIGILLIISKELPSSLSCMNASNSVGAVTARQWFNLTICTLLLWKKWIIFSISSTSYTYTFFKAALYLLEWNRKLYSYFVTGITCYSNISFSWFFGEFGIV